jgi:2-polyprenyl-3-methyl-5-hydroxy-6-metoxy-1,4-benzoquinol methylase
MVKGEPERGQHTAEPLTVKYRVDRVAKYLSGHWLDFGCAEGGYHEQLLSRGLDAITGVDIEEPRIAEAKSRHLPNAHYTSFDGSTLPFDDDSFDGVFMNEVIEHVADERRALSEIFRVVRPGGVLTLMAPNRWFPVEGHALTIGSKLTTRPSPFIPWLPELLTRSFTTARNYWPRQLERRVKDAGFSIEEVGFLFPTLERFPVLPPRGVAWYQRHFRRLDRIPVVQRFGISSLVVGKKPIA